MKKLFTAAVLICMFASCKKDVVRGTGNSITEERSTGEFSAVSSYGNAKVFISYAPEISVQVKGYPNLVAEYTTEIIDHTLQLRYRDDVNVKNDNIEVHITMPGFTGLSSNGASPIKATGHFNDAATLDISVTGNTTISIDEMNVGHYSINASGSSDIATLGVICNTALVELSGNGKVALSVIDKLNVKLSGNGEVSYKGNPEDVITNIQGSGTVVKL